VRGEPFDLLDLRATADEQIGRDAPEDASV
jgi:hypothetical protein